ncbi:putative replicase polyprotein [Wickerhamomyces ciferrii]|uniref:Replicase polyprotein n=1 Tax=Wickerhamomyces ciferrii (strain ATCC 14091 / BCRC 22168 / CBS 111 / JCM 3599 / NBRC 0793 / NRRL Y-1031 F-60-10) TaxID=1206466 RepID=K0KKK3_WICCF|nr:putative replicase polyprotein [Wickerhamomyces ciferrii]CCH41999.1 putative replicase polyprotein [Wickerhamomyces ciferrii]
MSGSYVCTCLTEWLSDNISCPACRSKIDQEPFFNVQLRDLCNTLFEMCQKISNDELIDTKRHKLLQVESYNKDVSSNNKFKSVFKNIGQAVVDMSDGVARCSNCHWEVEGDRCPNCNIAIGNRNELNIVSDDDTDLDGSRLGFMGPVDHWNTSDDEDFENYDSEIERRLRNNDEPDEDDLAFVVDDDDLGEEYTDDEDSEDDEVENREPQSPSSPNYHNLRRRDDEDDDDEDEQITTRRRYTPTFILDDEWEDTRDSDELEDLEDHQGLLRNSRFNQSSDDQDEDAESWNGFQRSSDIEAALSVMDVENPYELESDEDTNINIGRRGKAIRISDEDD